MQSEIEFFMRNKMTANMVRYAIDEAATRGKPWAYAKAVLTAKQREGIFDPSMLIKPQTNTVNRKTGEAPDKKASYDLEEFERNKYYVPRIGEEGGKEN